MGRPWQLSGVGMALKEDPAKGRAMIVDIIVMTKGNLAHAAHFLNIGRRYLYKLLYEHELWNDVDRIRQQRQQQKLEPDWLRQTRQSLRS